jgi:hypothetical protein
MKRPHVFLMQVSEDGSKNILSNLKYRNPHWLEKTRDKDHGEVNVGDLILVYFAGAAINYQKQLRMVYRVNKVSKGNVEFVFEQYQEVSPPLTLDQIRESVKKGNLNDVFLNCGRQGFNIRKIDYADYEKVLNLSKTLPSVSPIIEAEDLLENFVVNNWNPEVFFGKGYGGFKILEDRSGNLIGQQYDTKVVGIIDILCQDKSGNYLVIEIKKGSETSDETVGQLARYMGWVKENLAMNKSISGIIITGGYDEKLRYAIKLIRDSYLATYEMSFKINLTK